MSPGEPFVNFRLLARLRAELELTGRGVELRATPFNGGGVHDRRERATMARTSFGSGE